jgi:hypothetical protein
MKSEALRRGKMIKRKKMERKKLKNAANAHIKVKVILSHDLFQ